MIGIDIVSVTRFEKRTAEEFLGRVFNQNEVDYINSRTRKSQTMAGIFAAKEAIVKAIGTGFDGAVKFSDIAVLHNEKGMPVASLAGGAANRLKEIGNEISISISHTSETAVAVAVVR